MDSVYITSKKGFFWHERFRPLLQLMRPPLQNSYSNLYFFFKLSAPDEEITVAILASFTANYSIEIDYRSIGCADYAKDLPLF